MAKEKYQIYLNPDLIASGISPQNYEKASFQAGRVLITEVKSLIEKVESFAFESTLSGLAKVKRIIKDQKTVCMVGEYAFREDKEM